MRGAVVQFRCPACGANLAFDPAAGALACPSCGHREAVDAVGQVAESDYRAALARAADDEGTVEQLSDQCGNCGAEVVLAAHTVAGACPFCGGGIVAQGLSRRVIRPRSVLPFAVVERAAADAYRAWVAGRWFAPSTLARRAERSQIAGVYLPAWTYDAVAHTRYDGHRGDDYWDTETYTEYEGGKAVTRTRQVRQTRWHSVVGRVKDGFDDLLVMASVGLPGPMLARLEPWPLADLVPYADGYLSGFAAESYQVDLADGFGRAQGQMAGPIRRSVEADIGGDHQRVDSLDTAYADVTFKHVLLPVWISAYRFDGRTFRFVVNARTGEVQGERPYSAWKITLFVLLMLAIVAIAVVLIRSR